MDFNEVKQFIEENIENEEVQSYISGLTEITTDRVEEFLNNDDGKKLLQPKLDSYFNKGLETWKTNNIEKLLDEEIQKRFPEADPKDIELEKIRAELEKIKSEANRKELTNKALLIADEKKLPKDLVDYFIGNDEDTTNENLEVLEGVFSKHIEKLVDERLKGSGYTPPTGKDNKTFTLEEIKSMSDEDINKNWDVIQDVLKNK